MMRTTLQALLLRVLDNFVIQNFRKIFWEAFRFATVGLISMLIDFAIFISLTRLTDYFHEHYLQANVIGFCIAVINSYLLNKYWTFQQNAAHDWQQFAKFVGIMLVGSFVIAQTVLYTSVEILHIYDLIGKIIGVILGYIWNFFTAKYIVFKI